jgi:hypothetical protein
MGPLAPINGLRLLALAAGLRHNAEIGQPGLCFSAYGHKFGINHLAQRHVGAYPEVGRTSRGSSDQATTVRPRAPAADSLRRLNYARPRNHLEVNLLRLQAQQVERNSRDGADDRGRQPPRG